MILMERTELLTTFTMGINQLQDYRGFEQGPIRPPSEAHSLLIRVTRNCPWNKCSFCSVYKDRKFSLRPVEHVIRDIDAIHEALNAIQEELDKNPRQSADQIMLATGHLSGNRKIVFYTALDWILNGDGTVFLQDANSLIMKPEQLVLILNHLKSRFPWISRITSYARSHTINRIGETALQQLAGAGLTRIHIGMESGADRVLEQIHKGVNKFDHITAGLTVKRTGMELSEYVMPGIGGSHLSEEHALETADALNRINPDFIRLRSLIIQQNTPLFKQYHAGAFDKNTEIQTVAEIRRLIENLDGISSTITSDHVYNLLYELNGKLPQEKQKLLDLLDEFLALPEDDQLLFQFGRRTGYFHCLSDLQSPARRAYVSQYCNKHRINPANIDQVLETNTSNYI